MHIYQSGNWHSSGSTLAYRGLREERAPRNLSICSGMIQLQSFAFSLLYLRRRHSEFTLPYAMPVYLLKGRVIGNLPKVPPGAGRVPVFAPSSPKCDRRAVAIVGRPSDPARQAKLPITPFFKHDGSIVEIA